MKRILTAFTIIMAMLVINIDCVSANGGGGARHLSIDETKSKTLEAKCIYSYGNYYQETSTSYILEIYENNEYEFYQDNGSTASEEFRHTDLDLKNWYSESLGEFGYHIYKENGCPERLVNRKYGFLNLKSQYYLVQAANLPSLKDHFKWPNDIYTYNLVIAEDGREHPEITSGSLEPTAYTCEYSLFNLLFDANGLLKGVDNAAPTLAFYSLEENIKYSVNYVPEGKCPAAYVYSKTGISYITGTIYLDELAARDDHSNIETEYCTNTYDPWCDPGSTDSAMCPTYTRTLEEVEELYSTYKENLQTNVGSNALTTADQKIQKLNSLCNAVYKSSSYTSDCTQACLGFSKKIYELKIKYDIYTATASENACGISDRLVNWLLKILKWIRYGMPVIVILLSVIDFIKAISSDSDDEMKKVGSKFIKRLIAAALIFLVPFLLEFIINLFGLSTNNFCS